MATDTTSSLVSLDEARALGLRKYFTGKPCRRGHVTERFVSCKNCVACKAETNRRVRAENPEEAKALGAAYHQANRERNLARRRAWWHADAELHRAEHRAWAAVNREMIRERARAARAANPEHYRALGAAYYALKRGAPGTYNAEDIARLMRLQRGRCAGCRKDIRRSFHVDHVVALSKGGSNYPSNLQLLCPHCNIGKRDKDPLDWAAAKGRLL